MTTYSCRNCLHAYQVRTSKDDSEYEAACRAPGCEGWIADPDSMPCCGAAWSPNVVQRKIDSGHIKPWRKP